MRLSKVHIERLGGISNRAIESLSPTLNIIYGPNEAGKSTFKQAVRIGLFPIMSGQSANTYDETPGKRSVSIELSDGVRTFSLTRESSTKLKSEIHGTDEAKAALEATIGGVALSTYNKLFNVGPEDIQAVLSSDISPLLIAQWGTKANPVVVAQNLIAQTDVFKGKAEKIRDTSLTTLQKRLEEQKNKIVEVEAEYRTGSENQKHIEMLIRDRDNIDTSTKSDRNRLETLQADNSEVERFKKSLAESEASLVSAVARRDAELGKHILLSGKLNRAFVEAAPEIESLWNRLSGYAELINRLTLAKNNVLASEASLKPYSHVPDFKTNEDVNTAAEKLHGYSSQAQAASAPIDYARKQRDKASATVKAYEDELSRLIDEQSGQSAGSVKSRIPYSTAGAFGGIAAIAVFLGMLFGNSNLAVSFGVSALTFIIAGFASWAFITSPHGDGGEDTLQQRIEIVRDALRIEQGSLSLAEVDLKTSKQEFARVIEEYQRYVDSIELSQLRDIPPSEAHALLSKAQAKFGKAEKLHNEQMDVENIERDIRDYKEKVLKVLGPLFDEKTLTLETADLVALAKNKTDENLSCLRELTIAENSLGSVADTLEKIAAQREATVSSIQHIADQYTDEKFDIPDDIAALQDFLRDQISFLSESLDVTDATKAEINNEIGSLEEKVRASYTKDGLEDAQIELRKLERLYEQAITKRTVLEVAIQLLTQALENRSDNGDENLLDIASKLFAEMTGGRYTRIILANSGDGLVECESVGDGTEAVSRLSKGTIEQLFMSLRLGVLLGRDDMAPDAPILLDDTFAHSDHERRKVAFNALAKVAKQRQILYFTCHQNFADELEEAAKEQIPDSYHRIMLERMGV